MLSREMIRSIVTRGRIACAVPCDANCAEPCALASLPVGVRAVVVHLACPQAEAEHLRVMGVFEGANIGIVDRGSGFLLDVRGSRLAIGASLAAAIIALRVP